MHTTRRLLLLAALVLPSTHVAAAPDQDPPGILKQLFCDRGYDVRFATFNASLNRTFAGQLLSDLSTPANAQARTVAEIIQRTRPDVLLINEFDFDPASLGAKLFQDNYLSVSQNG